MSNLQINYEDKLKYLSYLSDRKQPTEKIIRYTNNSYVVIYESILCLPVEMIKIINEYMIIEFEVPYNIVHNNNINVIFKSINIKDIKDKELSLEDELLNKKKDINIPLYIVYQLNETDAHKLTHMFFCRYKKLFKNDEIIKEEKINNHKRIFKRDFVDENVKEEEINISNNIEYELTLLLNDIHKITQEHTYKTDIFKKNNAHV